MNQKLKRYDFIHTPLGSFIKTNDDGEYVTYEDYQKLQEQLEKAEEVIKHYKSYCVPQWVEVPGMNGMRGVQEIWLAREYFKEKESK